MNILFECRNITPNRSCGIENFTYSIIKSIADFDINNNIICSIPSWAVKEYEVRLEVKKRKNILLINNSIQKLLFSYNPSNFTRLIYFPIRKIFPFIDKVYRGTNKRWIAQTEMHADVVIYPYHHDVILHNSIPSILVLHDFFDFENSKPINLKRRAIIENNIKNTKAVVCCWPGPFSKLQKRNINDGKKIKMIPFLFDQPVYDISNQTAKPLRQFVYAASTAEHKNHVNLIKALGVLKRRGVEKIVVKCTGRIYKETWKQIAETIIQENVEEWIHFLGFVSREAVIDLYKSSMAVVAPTKYEAFSGTVMEGFQASLPIACSDIEPLKIFIDEFLNVKVSYFNPDEPVEIADSLMAIIENYTFFKNESTKAKKYFDSITPSFTASEYVDLIKEVLKSTS
jgi:glycosyltransferase involved in cell wall biosynthesis